MSIPRSCAIVHCEPCQGLTAAALSRPYDVPRGSFGGVNGSCNARASHVDNRCTALQTIRRMIHAAFLFLSDFTDIVGRSRKKTAVGHKKGSKTFSLTALSSSSGGSLGFHPTFANIDPGAESRILFQFSDRQFDCTIAASASRKHALESF